MTNDSDISVDQQQDSIVTRREAVGILSAGLVSVAFFGLAGCTRSSQEFCLPVLELLREKHGREFELAWYQECGEYERSPTVYCCEKGVYDLVFRASFDSVYLELIYENFIGRKLGRQTENLITERLASVGIRSVSLASLYAGAVGAINDQEETDPEISLDDFLDNRYFTAIRVSIVIAEEVRYGEKRPVFSATISELFAYLKVEPGTAASIYVVEEDQLIHFVEYLRYTAFFGKNKDAPAKFIDGYYMKITEDGLEYVQGQFWKEEP